MLFSMLMLLLILLFVFVDFCLLNDVILLEYDVIIKLNMFNGNLDLFFFEGNVKIKIECKMFMNKVILYGNMFIISNVKFGVIVDFKRMFFVFEFDL